MRLPSLVSLVMLCLTLTAVSLQANPLKIQLVSNTTHIRPGQPFEVGLHLRHPPAYHTYWKQPGIVGVATQMEWNLPKGWKADPIQWPAPKRIFMFQIRAQGYHDEVLLPIKITPPIDLTPGERITLKGKASWMCCGRDCNPGTTKLKLSLPVSDAVPSEDPRWSALFAKAHANIPQPLKNWTANATIKGEDITLTLTPASADKPLKSHIASIQEVLFFTDDGLVNPDKEQRLEKRKDGSLVLHLKVSEYFTDDRPTQLTGVVQTAQLWSASGPASATIAAPLKTRD